MADKWVNRAVACQVKGISERTLRRWINEGKIQSKREGKGLFVLVDIADTEAVNNGQGADIQADTTLIEQVRRENELLREQLTEKDKQIGKLQEQLSDTQKESGEAKERSDMLLLNSQRQLENTQRMLESAEQKAKRGLWSRLFRKVKNDG
jgi:predicted site-specific integrase-resolvase